MANRSSLRLVTLFAALVLGLIVLARAFLTSDGAGGEIENDPAPSVSQPADAAESAPPTALVSAKSEASASAPVAAPATDATSERAAAATLDELDLADAVWVSGTVHFPEHTPMGEVVEVIANGKKFKNREMHRARVNPDGSFRVAFAKETRTGRLAIDADHLFLPKPLVVKPADAPSGLVLEPELGGRILGVVIPPVGVADAAKELEGATMQLFGWDPTRRSEAVNLSAKLDKDLHFEFRGVPLVANCSVSCHSKFWLPDRGEVGVAAGVDTPLELRLNRGVRLAGKVLDADGAPVTGAGLSLRCEGSGGRVSSSHGEMASPKDGNFDLCGKEPGKITLIAQKKGFLDATQELGKLEDGDVRDSLELRLQSGASISGRVVWPDGTPAEKAMVSAVAPAKESGEWMQPRDLQFAAAADGSFKITGLVAGSFVVTASGTPRQDEPQEEAAAEEPAQAEKKPAKKSIARGPKWTAKQEDVPAGSDSLVLTLQSGYALSGRVVDEVGAPLDRFQIVATPKEAEDGPRTALPRAVLGSFRDDGGAFVLEGLHAGAWNVVVKAKGFTFPEEGLAVEVPDRLALGSLVVTRAAVLRGQVLAPDGTPIARAQVEIDMADDSPRGWRGMGNDKRVLSDAKGRFEFKSAPSGECTLRATHEGLAPSAALALNVVPGQTLEDLTLTMRRGGKLELELASGAGPNRSGRQLSLYGQFQGGDWRQATTDAGGHVTLEGLAPGDWQVTLEPSPDELEAQGSEGSREDWMLRNSLMKQARVAIVEGETAHVVLGAPPKAPVEVRGVVRTGGSPMAGAGVQAFLHSGSDAQPKFARCDAKGAYRMTLDQAGSYSFGASRDGMNASQWKNVTVPDGAGFVLDIDLPSGSIAGLVLGPDGAGLASAWVSIELEKPQLTSEPVSGFASTDDSGAFRLENLPAGVYTLTANGQGSHRTDGADELGAESVHGLNLSEGGTLRDVELRLAPGGSLQGVVRGPDGKPAGDAMVYVLDASGERVEATGSDDNGRYEFRGVRAGSFTIGAMQANQLSDPVEVRIVAGEKTKLDLQLRAGAELVVEVQDRDGTPVGASISVQDSRGRNQTLMRSEASADKSSRTVGPLAAGDYTVIATNHDGGQASATVHVSSQETKTVQLKFGGG